MTPETLSEGTKILKIDYLVKAIKEHKMDRAILFCRTKIDCDNCEKFLQTMGGGNHNNNNNEKFLYSA